MFTRESVGQMVSTVTVSKQRLDTAFMTRREHVRSPIRKLGCGTQMTPHMLQLYRPRIASSKYFQTARPGVMIHAMRGPDTDAKPAQMLDFICRCMNPKGRFVTYVKKYQKGYEPDSATWQLRYEAWLNAYVEHGLNQWHGRGRMPTAQECDWTGSYYADWTDDEMAEAFNMRSD